MADLTSLYFSVPTSFHLAPSADGGFSSLHPPAAPKFSLCRHVMNMNCRQQLPLSASGLSFRLYGRVGKRGVLYRAKTKPNDVQITQEEELDEDLRVGLNEVSNEAVKVMLSEDSRLVNSFREKVDYLGDYLIQEGHTDAARFMMVMKGMLDHRVLPEKDNLEGIYKKAFDKIWSIVEDSGWLLKVDNAETGVEMVDDELIPPVLQSQYRE